MRLLVDTKVVHLHPDFNRRLRLKLAGLPASGNATTDAGVANNETSRAYVFGRHLLHIIGEDKRRNCEPVIAEFRHHDAPAPAPDAMPVRILQDHIQREAAPTASAP